MNFSKQIQGKEKGENMKKTYIALDIEAAGNRLGHHPTLSIGACLVFRDGIPSFQEALAQGMIFYAELKPDSLEYEYAAMQVGCSQLCCLEREKKKSRYLDVADPSFDPK